MRPRPQVVVFATDGQGPAPTHAPQGVSVIWLLLGDSRKPYSGSGYGPIDWGDFITVPDNDEEEVKRD